MIMRTKLGSGRRLVSKNDSCTSLGPTASPEPRQKVECNGVRLQSEHYYASYCFTSLTCAQAIGGLSTEKMPPSWLWSVFCHSNTESKQGKFCGKIGRGDRRITPETCGSATLEDAEQQQQHERPDSTRWKERSDPQSCPLSSTHTSWHVGPHLWSAN